MTNGGAIAKQRFRYQDMCAMYFSLKNYLQESDAFEHVYCEQNKLDFEIWCTNYFKGYQVKDIKGSLGAKETNQILEYYLKKSVESGKSNKAFYFVFSRKPKNSLYYLLLKLKGNVGVQKYNKRTEQYIETALTNLVTDGIIIDYHCYDRNEIEYLVYAISSKVLKSELNAATDFPSEVIRDFLSRLRDEIDSISSENEESNRVYESSRLQNLIKTFLSRVEITKLDEEGERKEVIAGSPIRPEKPLKPSIARPKTPSVTEGKELGNL
jgi:hypothetical protein